jgi:hypothetical protein
MTTAARHEPKMRTVATSEPRSGSISPIRMLIAGALHFWPRLFILGFVIFSRQIGDAFSSWVVWVVGFLILPWTTLIYAMAWGIYSDGVHGAEWLLVFAAFLVDMLTWALSRLR